MSVIIFLILLSVLVLIHELGHYLAARIFGVKAEEFGFGFPPRAIGVVKDKRTWKIVGAHDEKKYPHTIWSLNWLPLGGFVRIKGEEEDGVNDADSIHAKPIWQRFVIIAAGVVMNWILAIALFSALFFFGTRAVLEHVPAEARITDRAVTVMRILPGSPAQAAGLQIGDRILSVNGDTFENAEKTRDAILKLDGTLLRIRIKRNGSEMTVEATPTYLADVQRSALGIALADEGIVSLPLGSAIVNGAIMTWDISKSIIVAFGGIFRDIVVRQKVAEDVSGPVGIAVITGEIAKQGWSPFLQFAGVLSVNLAVINFLPIPALDGGRALFLVIEKIRRRPVSRKLEIAIHNIAFLFLILLIILVSARDVFRHSGLILGGVRSLVGL